MLGAGPRSSRLRDAHIPLLVARLSTCGESFPSRARRGSIALRGLAGPATSIADNASARCRLSTITRRSNAARRYWQLADSDGAVAPRGALSTAAVRQVTERSDEHIEGQTFDVRDGP